MPAMHAMALTILAAVSVARNCRTRSCQGGGKRYDHNISFVHDSSLQLNSVVCRSVDSIGEMKLAGPDANTG